MELNEQKYILLHSVDIESIWATTHNIKWARRIFQFSLFCLNEPKEKKKKKIAEFLLHNIQIDKKPKTNTVCLLAA